MMQYLSSFSFTYFSTAMDNLEDLYKRKLTFEELGHTA